MKVKRGNIVYLKPQSVRGHIQSNERPYLVVSNDIGNQASEIVMVVPMTTQLKKLSQPTHTIISYHDSMVLCEQIMTINQEDIVRVVYRLNDYQMTRVDKCLKKALGIV